MTPAADLRAVLSGAGFRRLYATRLTAQLADGVVQAGLASYVLFSPQRRASGAEVATAFAILLLPYSLIGPFVGVLLDRWRRRQVLLGSGLLRTALVACLAVLVGRGEAGTSFLLAALALLGVARFFLAALSAALPHVVDEPRLVTANALATTSGTVAATVGAAIGLAARTLSGGGDTASAAVVGAAALGYLLSAGAAATLGRDQLGPDRSERPGTWQALRGVAAGLVAGARHLAEQPAALRALGAIGAHRFLFGAVTVLVVILERSAFHAPSDANGGLAGVSVVFAATGLGIVVAALVTPPAVRRLGTDRYIVVLLTLAALGTLCCGLPLAPAPLVALGFVLGGTGQGVKICVDTTLQERLVDRYRGRVFALYDVLYNVTFVAAAALAAALLPVDGRSRTVVALTAAGYLAAAVLYAHATRRSPRLPQPSG